MITDPILSEWARNECRNAVKETAKNVYLAHCNGTKK